MDSRIALAANTQLHFHNKEGGAVRYTIIKEIGRGGSCIVYDASYETNTGDIKCVRIKECYPAKMRIERALDGHLTAHPADNGQFEAVKSKFQSDFSLGNGLSMQKADSMMHLQQPLISILEMVHLIWCLPILQNSPWLHIVQKICVFV